MEFVTTVALISVIIAAILLVVRPRSATKRELTPSLATAATPPTTAAAAAEPTPVGVRDADAAIVSVVAAAATAPTPEADAVPSIVTEGVAQPPSDVDAGRVADAIVQGGIANALKLMVTPRSPPPAAAATSTSVTTPATTPATKSNAPSVAVARQPRGPSPGSGFTARAGLCTGTQNLCGCGICAAPSPSPPPTPPPMQRCLPAGRKGSPSPPRPRFARLKLCKWESGKHAAEGCWEHNQNRGCAGVHKDQPGLLAELRRSRPRSAAPPPSTSSPARARKQQAYAQPISDASSSDDDWVRAGPRPTGATPPPHSRIVMATDGTAGWTVVQPASPRPQPKHGPGNGKPLAAKYGATFSSFSSCSSPSRSRKGMRSHGANTPGKSKRGLTPLAA